LASRFDGAICRECAVASDGKAGERSLDIMRWGLVPF
jgi:hypothetical protein